MPVGTAVTLQLLEGRAFNALTLLVALASLVASAMQVILILRGPRRRHQTRPRSHRSHTPGGFVLWSRLTASARWRDRSAALVVAAAMMAAPMLAIFALSKSATPSTAEACAANNRNSPPSAAVSITLVHVEAQDLVEVTGTGFPRNSGIDLAVSSANLRTRAYSGRPKNIQTSTGANGTFTAYMRTQSLVTDSCVFVSIDDNGTPSSTTAVAVTPT